MYSWEVEIEKHTIREQCAIDAGLMVIKQDRGYALYSTNDKEVWLDYLRYLEANRSAIRKQELLDRYTY